jgi:hypothetical protein
MEEIGWLGILLLNLKEYSYTFTLALLARLGVRVADTYWKIQGG